MPQTITVGNATVIALTDSQEPESAKVIYPEITDADLDRVREFLTPEAQVMLHFGSYVIRSDGRTVLIDTGWGPYPGHQAKLMDEIAAAGIRVDEIDVVTFTHLHVDHYGWNVDREGGVARPRFPKARYLLPEKDWVYFNEQAKNPDRQEEATPYAEQVQALEALGVTDLIGGDHVFAPSLTSVHTPGHTPGHLSFLVRSAGQQIFVLGDVAICQADALNPGWKTVYDELPDVNLQTRPMTLDRLAREGMLVAANHFPGPGFGRFAAKGAGWEWQPLA